MPVACCQSLTESPYGEFVASLVLVAMCVHVCLCGRMLGTTPLCWCELVCVCVSVCVCVRMWVCLFVSAFACICDYISDCEVPYECVHVCLCLWSLGAYLCESEWANGQVAETTCLYIPKSRSLCSHGWTGKKGNRGQLAEAPSGSGFDI